MKNVVDAPILITVLDVVVDVVKHGQTYEHLCRLLVLAVGDSDLLDDIDLLVLFCGALVVESLLLLGVFDPAIIDRVSRPFLASVTLGLATLAFVGLV